MNIGETLRKARLEKNLSYQEIEKSIKIRSRYLAALENEEWDVLPGDVYLKGFLKTYSRYLGLNAQEMLDALKEQLQPIPEIKPVTQDKIEFPDRPRKKFGLVLGVIAIFFLLFAQYLYQNYFNMPYPSNKDVNPSQVSSDSSQQSLTPEQDPKNEDPAPTNTVITEMSLRIIAVNGPCWIQVQANGLTTYEGTLQMGDQQSFTNLQKVSFTLGSAGAVQVFLNDQEIENLGAIKKVVTKTYIIEDKEIKEI